MSFLDHFCVAASILRVELQTVLKIIPSRIESFIRYLSQATGLLYLQVKEAFVGLFESSFVA